VRQTRQETFRGLGRMQASLEDQRRQDTLLGWSWRDTHRP